MLKVWAFDLHISQGIRALFELLLSFMGSYGLTSLKSTLLVGTPSQPYCLKSHEPSWPLQTGLSRRFVAHTQVLAWQDEEKALHEEAPQAGIIIEGGCVQEVGPRCKKDAGDAS